MIVHANVVNTHTLLNMLQDSNAFGWLLILRRSIELNRAAPSPREPTGLGSLQIDVFEWNKKKILINV